MELTNQEEKPVTYGSLEIDNHYPKNLSLTPYKLVGYTPLM